MLTQQLQARFSMSLLNSIMKRRQQFGRPKCRWIFKCTSTEQAQNRVTAILTREYVSQFLTDGRLIHQVNECQLLQKESALWTGMITNVDANCSVNMPHRPVQ